MIDPAEQGHICACDQPGSLPAPRTRPPRPARPRPQVRRPICAGTSGQPGPATTTGPASRPASAPSQPGPRPPTGPALRLHLSSSPWPPHIAVQVPSSPGTITTHAGGPAPGRRVTVSKGFAPGVPPGLPRHRRSSPRRRPAVTGSLPGGCSKSASASRNGPWPRPCGPRRATSQTGPRSGTGRPGSPQPRSLDHHPSGNWAASATLKVRPEWLICAPRQILPHG